jgi:hypothetical protein
MGGLAESWQCFHARSPLPKTLHGRSFFEIGILSHQEALDQGGIVFSSKAEGIWGLNSEIETDQSPSHRVARAASVKS